MLRVYVFLSVLILIVSMCYYRKRKRGSEVLGWSHEIQREALKEDCPLRQVRGNETRIPLLQLGERKTT